MIRVYELANRDMCRGQTAGICNESATSGPVGYKVHLKVWVSGKPPQILFCLIISYLLSEVQAGKVRNEDIAEDGTQCRNWEGDEELGPVSGQLLLLTAAVVTRYGWTIFLDLIDQYIAITSNRLRDKILIIF